MSRILYILYVFFGQLPAHLLAHNRLIIRRSQPQQPRPPHSTFKWLPSYIDISLKQVEVLFPSFRHFLLEFIEKLFVIFNIMSKPTPPATRVQSSQRTSLRNLKLSKINKHIENLQFLVAYDGSQMKEGKQNQMLNIDRDKKYHYLKDQQEQQLKQTVNNDDFEAFQLERQQLMETIKKLEGKVEERQEDIHKMVEERQELEEIINYLKNQNNFLREETKTLQESRQRIYQEQSTERSLEGEQFDHCFDKTQKFQQYACPSLLELHNQNSLLVTKIMELTYGRSKEEVEIQTERNPSTEAECQTESPIFQELQYFCSKQEFEVPFPQILSNFTENLEKHMTSLVQKHTRPLKCQIQLLQELIRSSKKQNSEKVAYMTRLLQQAQKTIKGLMQEMKNFQKQSKANYSLYLSALKEHRRQQ